MKPFNLNQMGARYGISVQTGPRKQWKPHPNKPPVNYQWAGLLSNIFKQSEEHSCWLGFEWSGTSLTSMALTNEERKSGHAISAFSSVARSVQWLAEAIGLTGID
jgi:hypothetical protein